MEPPIVSVRPSAYHGMTAKEARATGAIDVPDNVPDCATLKLETGEVTGEIDCETLTVTMKCQASWSWLTIDVTLTV